jgi:hypothetical protein
MTDPCEGETVVEHFYGDGVRYAPGWWGRCGECGNVVGVQFWDGREFPAVHWAVPRLTPGPPASGPSSGPRPGVLLLSCDDLALVQQLVGALDGECGRGPEPEAAVDRPNSSATRVAVFIEALYIAGSPAAWQGRSGDIGYDSPAAYRILGFVSVDPQ